MLNVIKHNTQNIHLCTGFKASGSLRTDRYNLINASVAQRDKVVAFLNSLNCEVAYVDTNERDTGRKNSLEVSRIEYVGKIPIPTRWVFTKEA